MQMTLNKIVKQAIISTALIMGITNCNPTIETNYFKEQIYNDTIKKVFIHTAEFSNANTILYYMDIKHPNGRNVILMDYMSMSDKPKLEGVDFMFVREAGELKYTCYPSGKGIDQLMLSVGQQLMDTHINTIKIRNAKSK
jgi:hypothetical protein